ncbi:hypothetical protein ABZ484_27810 [Streptomyces sp. NPDC006393]|uniref:hypothetical protein n=1 Tax=Streptomyces sp. NPDC006393 TaxID=3156763 RepID=UPI0034076A64
MSISVATLITPDGIMSDPGGSPGAPLGGRTSGHGGRAVGMEDGYRLGRALDERVPPLARLTWQRSARIRPGRRDPYAAWMHAAAKPATSRTPSDADTSARADLRLFPAHGPRTDLELPDTEHIGPAVLTQYRRAAR